ncbi:hypothetical protein Tco_0975567 [Tanacetum coccineum]|uniref:MAK10-like protein n=1 Tax=Tanacetum coccineum TaxID=301880 RepID=A0ABQ5EET3_9ASTR
MQAHLAHKPSVQVNKIASSCEICSGPYDTQYCIENLEQAFVDYASSCNNEVGGKSFTINEEPSDDRNVVVKDEKMVEKESKVSKIIVEKGESSDLGNINKASDLKDEIYETLIEKMPSCSLNFDFRIEKRDPSNLKIPCMIQRIFIANAYIDLDLPMNVMSLAYYNAIRNKGYEHRGLNFVGVRKDMHVFVGNMSHVMDFTVLENVEANIDPSLSQVVFGRPFVETTKLILDRERGLITFTDGIKEVTFKTPYRDPEMDDLTSEGHDLLSSRVILSDDDFRRGCESRWI